MNQLKPAIQAFVASLHIYDYILFAISGLLFLLILLLAIVLRKKTALSLFLVLIALVIIAVAPVGGYNYIHGILYKTEISDLQIKKLEFSQALVIKGKLSNLGRQSYHMCKITANAYKAPENFFQELINPLKPFQKMSILSKEELSVNQSMDFKLIMEPFTYSKEYNLSVKANCL